MQQTVTNKPKTVAVGMSGGVDSSLAAALLKQEGHIVIGLTMEIFDGEHDGAPAGSHACYGPGEQDDVRQAREVCTNLGIPHYVIDLRDEYRKIVLDYFKKEYCAGRTPNPCTRCNPTLKFGLMLDKARLAGLSFDLFATGHYVRTDYDRRGKRYVLKKGIDSKKDQSYFLYAIRPQQLSGLVFPLGNLTKEQVRAHAAELGLPVSARPESQDFIEGGNYAGLFSKEQCRPGDIVDTAGKKRGLHNGIINYTIGQRRGIGIAHCEPLYVVAIDAADNTITVGPKQQLYAHGLIAEHAQFLSIDRPREPLQVSAKIRHNHTAASATLTPLAAEGLQVVFDRPQLAITPGQAVVFYDEDILLGGGIIQKAFGAGA